MSLPKPTYEKLLEVINEIGSWGNGYSCCQNCYSITNDYERCAECNLWRCEKCRPIHLAMRNNLSVYLCLELDFGFPILDSLLHAYHIDAQFCSSCDTSFCTRCRVMHLRKVVIRKKFIHERYECDRCFSDCDSGSD